MKKSYTIILILLVTLISGCTLNSENQKKPEQKDDKLVVKAGNIKIYQSEIDSFRKNYEYIGVEKSDSELIQ